MASDKKPPDLNDDMFLVTPEDGGAPTLSFSRSPTVQLVFAANRFTRSSARLFEQRFGIGAMDWRMLVMLTREPGSTVSHAGRVIGIDKAAVSRSLGRIRDKGLAVQSAEQGGWVLTQEGQALHDAVLKVALERQQKLLAGLSREDVETFTRCLGMFLSNLDTLDADGEA